MTFYSQSTHAIFAQTIASLKTIYPPETLQELIALLENGRIHDVKDITAIIDKLPLKEKADNAD